MRIPLLREGSDIVSYSRVRDRGDNYYVTIPFQIAKMCHLTSNDAIKWIVDETTKNIQLEMVRA